MRIESRSTTSPVSRILVPNRTNPGLTITTKPFIMDVQLFAHSSAPRIRSYWNFFNEICDVATKARINPIPLTQATLNQNIHNIYEIVSKCARTVFGLDGLRVYSFSQQQSSYKVKSIFDDGIKVPSRSVLESCPVGEKLELSKLINLFLSGKLESSQTSHYAVQVGKNNDFFAWLICDRSGVSGDFALDREYFPETPDELLKQNIYIVTRRDKKAIVYMLPNWETDKPRRSRIDFVLHPNLMIDLIRHAETNIENLEHKYMEHIAERDREIFAHAKEMSEIILKMILKRTHDVKNRLSVISGYVHILTRLRQLSDDETRYSALIQESCRDAADLNFSIDELAANMANAHSAKVDVTKKVHLNSLLSYIFEEFWRKADPEKKSKICFKYTFENESDYFAKADADIVQSAIEELLLNALKYTEKGEIEIWVKMIEQNRSIEISLRDTGKGIKDDELGDIFTHYRGSSSDGTYGTGMGLVFVKYFIKLLGGNIKVFSKGTDKGSTFVIELQPYYEPSDVLIGG